MKQLVFLIYFLPIVVVAQSNVETKQFVSDIFSNKDQKIVYQNKLDDLTIIELQKALSDSVIYKLDSLVVDSIILTRSERDYIKSQLKANNLKGLPRNFIPKSRVISRSKVKRIFSEPYSGWETFNEKYGPALYGFTTPIFIRNSTICFFYDSVGYGSLAGSSLFGVYIKKNKVWRFYSGLLFTIS